MEKMKENNQSVPTIEIQAESQRNALLVRLEERGVKPAQLEQARHHFAVLNAEEVIINVRIWSEALNSLPNPNGDIVNRIRNFADLSPAERRKYLNRCGASLRRKRS